VILKDVLGESLADIAALLELSVHSVKSHLARGRARLREIDAQPAPALRHRTPSEAVTRYVTLFNRGDWPALRALLADDVRLMQSSHPARRGAEDVGLFFSTYAKLDQIRVAAAWLDERAVIAVFDGEHDAAPGYFTWLQWEKDRIVFIRDYRYDRYVMPDAQVVLVDSPTPSSRWA
jgi:RNA polymerase sigma-70 factor (ECF subfamily)